jgi:putative FmdB family regulatory protein
LPLYEYRCTKCGAQVEKIQKFSDPPLETCEKCRGPLERLLSSPAIQFKGSGWYVTDYARRSAPSEPAKAEGTSAPPANQPAEPSKTSPATNTKPPSD